MESGKIVDGQITASTNYNSGHGASNGRLNFKAGGGLAHGQPSQITFISGYK